MCFRFCFGSWGLGEGDLAVASAIDWVWYT
jgi:hypothetical protein